MVKRAIIARHKRGEPRTEVLEFEYKERAWKQCARSEQQISGKERGSRISWNYGLAITNLSRVPLNLGRKP
jgi:hypothetical protein